MSLDVYLEMKIDTGGAVPYRLVLFEGNITHNLRDMAAEVGIYDHIWHPKDVGISTASELIEPLGSALGALATNADHLIAHFSPENDWGTYQGFFRFVSTYLQACISHPKANVVADA